MRQNMRIKKVPKEIFDEIASLRWEPVQFTPETMPACLSGIPSNVLCCAYGSISPSQATPYPDCGVPIGDLIGGVDVYRYSPDDPVPLNRDWYALVKPYDDSRCYLLDGPRKPHNHWLEEIPGTLRHARIWAVPKKTEPSSAGDSSTRADAGLGTPEK
jgi:hypothetical protein